MINFIFFSKDRAPQLDLSLRSFLANCNKINKSDFKISILYTVSNGFHKLGYDKLIEKYSKIVNFVPEINFKEQYLELISNLDYVLNLSDDILFINEIDLDDKYFNIFKSRNDIVSFACRLGKNINIAWSSEGVVPRIPKFNSNNMWKWESGGPWETWYYPMAVCGQIFDCRDFSKYIKPLKFKSPSSFESIMCHNPMKKPYMICPEHSWIIELSANRVSTEINHPKFGNQHQNILNDAWINGFQIKYPINVPTNVMINTEYHLELENK